MATVAASSSMSKDDIAKTFAFLDADGQGNVTMATLKKRLGTLFPNMTTKEYRFLMGGQKELTLEDLTEFMATNEVSDPEFDPVAEAFKCYDQQSMGVLKRDRLREIFTSFQMGESNLSDAELDAILQLADVDGDGKVTYDDFKAMVMSQKGDGGAEGKRTEAAPGAAAGPETA